MPTVRIVASALFTALIIGLLPVLVPPAFDLESMGAAGGLGPGTLPQFAVIVVPLLAIASFISDFARYRRDNRSGRNAAESETDPSDPKRVVGIGSAVLVALAFYATAWRFLGFPVASIGFMGVMALLLAPPAGRRPKGLAVIAATTLVFCLGTWGFFVHVLGVPLR